MQSVDGPGLDALERRFQEALRLWPSMKKECLARMGQAALGEVRKEIARSGMSNGGGRVQGWQRVYLGSKGGYTAVRAIGEDQGGGTGPNSAGAITNYTENGHRIRRPAAVQKNGYRYRPRIKVAAVRGFHYYHQAETRAVEAALAAGRELAQQAADMIGGESA